MRPTRLTADSCPTRLGERQNQALKKTNEEEIAALKLRLSELEQKVMVLQLRVATLHEPKAGPSKVTG